MLLVEAKSDEEGWTRIGVMPPGSPVLCIGAEQQPGREVILFGCEGPVSVILRSRGGYDKTLGLGRLLHVTSGLETLAVLEPRDSYELAVVGRTGPMRIRWTHIP